MKIFKFGYGGYECPEYVSFTNQHNDQLQFEHDCKQVIRILTREALAKKKRLADYSKNKYDELHICNLPHTYVVSHFFNSKRIIEEMTKLGYKEAESETVYFMPFLDCVDPNDSSEETTISKEELIDIFSPDLLNEIIEYNNLMLHLKDQYHHDKYDAQHANELVKICDGIIFISTNKFIKKCKDGFEAFSPALNIRGFGSTKEEATAGFELRLDKFCELPIEKIDKTLKALGFDCYTIDFSYGIDFSYEEYNDYRFDTISINRPYTI